MKNVRFGVTSRNETREEEFYFRMQRAQREKLSTTEAQITQGV